MNGSNPDFASLFDRLNLSVVGAAGVDPNAQENGVVTVNRPLNESSAEQSLRMAFDQAYQDLLAFASRDDFESNMALAFGPSYDAVAAGEFFEQFKVQGADAWAKVSVVSGEQLSGANGLYVQATDEVYLSDVLLSPGRSEQLTEVLLEELGHRIDAQINVVDAAGDEGEIFARLVQGESLLPSVLARLRAENDHLQLERGGLLIEAEANAAPQLLWRHYGVGQNLAWTVNPDQTVIGSGIDVIPDVNWRIQGTGDFNGDGKLDRVLRHHGVGYNLIQYTDGNNQVTGAASLPAIPDIGWHIEGTGDFDQDGDSDIVLRHYGSGHNLLWIMNGTQVERAEALPVIPDLNWHIEVVEDFNRDANPDLVLRHRLSGQNLLWTMLGSTVQRSEPLPTIEDTNWRIEGAGDFNQDGRTDLMLRHYGVGANLVWAMEGATVTGALSLPTVADTNWQPTVVGELPSQLPIKFTSFNQNNTIISGLVNNITWEDQLSEKVFVSIYKGGELQSSALTGVFEKLYGTTSDGNYAWDSVIESMPAGNDYQLQIKSVTNAEKYAFSPYFTVEDPSIQVLMPNSGQPIQAGKEYEITWTSNVKPSDRFRTSQNDSGGIQLDLYKDGEKIENLTSYSNTRSFYGTEHDGSFVWTAPHLPDAGANYQLEAYFYNASAAKRRSQVFAIQPKADLDIQLFNHNNTFNSTQWQAFNVAAQNWERLITNDKESDGNFRVVAFGENDLGRRTFAEAFIEDEKNSRRNLSNDNVRSGIVDIGGVDYDNSVVWNLSLLSDLNSSDLIKIMMHELGHTLGLRHEYGNASSLMDNAYDQSNNEVLVISDTTFSGLENLGYRVDRSAVNSLVWTI